MQIGQTGCLNAAIPSTKCDLEQSQRFLYQGKTECQYFLVVVLADKPGRRLDVDE